VLPEFRKLARQAQSKPGHARDGFVELARTFERKAPAVLPTFHEQVARVFVDVGNLKFAATFFDKARAAEASYGLVTDPSRTATAFLEFALVGAVTVKSIQAWIKDVGAAAGAASALDRFLALAVGRTHGGLPPWAAFAKDLARLATAAGVEPREAQGRWLREVMGAPALDHAPAAVWDELAPAIVALAGGDAAFQDALASRFPKGSTSRWDDVEDDFADRWLALLQGAGVFARVASPAYPAPATWLERFLDWVPDRYGPALQVLRYLAPHVQGAAVVVRRSWVDPDVVDLALELGVGLTLHEDADLRLRGWAAGEDVPAGFGLPAEPRPRSLAALLAHPQHAATLAHLVPRVLSEDAFNTVARARPPIARMRLDALRGLLASLAKGPLGAADDALDSLTNVSWAELQADPELAGELAAVDVAPALAASLRGGVLEERGWPAYDAVVDELGSDELTLGGGWPWVVVASPRRAVVLGPDGARVAAFDLKVPKGGTLRAVRWLDGALLVGLDTDDGERAYWSSAPADLFEADIPWYGDPLEPVFPVPGGGVFAGGGVVRAGDRGGWPEQAEFLSDGTHAWTVTDDDRLTRVDPATGRRVEGPPPSFLADVPAERLGSCWLSWLGDPAHPAPVGLRTLDGDTWETLAGDTWAGNTSPDWLGPWPGGGGARALEKRWRGLQLFDPQGDVVDEAPDAGQLPARCWWHTTVRDPAGSDFLRAVDVDVARALLDAVPADAEPDAAAAAVGAAAPAIAAPRLRAGVVRQVARAQALAERLGEWRQGGATDSEDELPDGTPTLSDWSDVLGVAGPGSTHDGTDLLRAMREESVFLAGATDAAPLAIEESFWAIGTDVRAVGWVLARPGLPDAERERVRAVLTAWCALPALSIREASWSFPDLSSPFLRTRLSDGERNLIDDWVVVEGDTRFVVHTDDTWSDEGPFDVTTRSVGPGSPPGATLERDEVRPPPAPQDVAWVAALLAADPRREALVAADVERLAAATGLSGAAATLLLAAGPGFYAWRNWLGDYRERLDLKVKEAEAGRTELQRLGGERLRAVLAAAAPDDPAAFAAPDVGRVIERFLAAFGAQVPVPAELRAAAEKQLGGDWILDALGAPDLVSGLARDAEYVVSEELSITVKGDVFDADAVAQLVKGVPWALSVLPAGDPLRANLGRLLDLVLARLAAPGMWLDGGNAWPDDEKQGRKWLDVVAGRAEGNVRTLPGLRVILADDCVTAIVNPATFGAEAAAAAAALAARSGDDEFAALPTALGFVPRLRAWREHLRTEALPTGAYAANPAISAPEAVSTVVSRWKLPTEAAVLYLQTLALPNPTKKDVCAWNGWTPKAYDRAADALVAAKLMVEGKRPRAGRSHFLPGGWVEARPVPYERWKLQLLGGVERRSSIELPFGESVAVYAPHEAFALARDRLAAGDLPKFG
jgi:hypothetical protein